MRTMMNTGIKLMCSLKKYISTTGIESLFEAVVPWYNEHVTVNNSSLFTLTKNRKV